MRLPVLISACLSLATTWVIAKNTEFSQSRNLPPLRLAAADLDTIFLRTQALIAEANGPSGEQDSARETVKLGVGGHEIAISHRSLASSVVHPSRRADEQWNHAAGTCLHCGSITVRTTANRKTATAKANATTRTLRCSNFPEALAKKRTVANKTVFARY